MWAYSSERKGSFRINTLKSSENEVLEEFKSKGIIVEPYSNLPWVYLFSHEQEYALKGTDAFYKGKIYLQSLASMLPVIALHPEKWEHILDVCAAPGSKTTQMAMMMENEWKIIALEQNRIRFDKLMYNSRLQWATIIEWKKVDARKFFDGEHEEYDRILLDAPCSAEWRIQIENEKSYGFWSLENIAKKAELQYELLTLAVKSLKNWGTLVYSTCTLAPEENEGIISQVLSENHDLTLEPIEIGLSDKPWWRNGLISFEGKLYGEEMKKTVRIVPSEETEGFYMAKIMKR